MIKGEEDEQEQTFSSFLVSGATLDPKIRAKIWSGQYVELGSLIPRTEVSGGIQLSYARNSISQVSLIPSRPRQPANFTEWLRWFTIFASVYTEKFPDAAPQMFTYIQRILALASRKPATYAWRSYDERFRQVKAFNPAATWHLVNETLWRDAEESTRNNFRDFSRDTNTPAPKQDWSQKNYCRDFNQSGKRCTREPCSFIHHCSKCDKAHPAFRCPGGGHPCHCHIRQPRTLRYTSAPQHRGTATPHHIPCSP